MKLAVVALLALAAGVHALVWLVLHQITVASLRRAVRRGAVDASLGAEVRSFRLNAFGSNPGLHQRYLPFEVRPGEVVVVHGRAHPDREYLSIVLYDPILQSVPPREGRPTWVQDPPADAEGRFRLVLAHEDPGEPGWLDVSAVPSGVYWERHAGPEPTDRTTFERH